MSKIRKCAGHDSLHRINYLYQICNDTASNVEGNEVSSMYGNLLIAVGKKSVQRLDIDMKRTLCKRCHNILLPGVTSTVRIKKKKVQTTCNKCKYVKCLNIKNKNYKCWTQCDESIVEIIDYNK